VSDDYLWDGSGPPDPEVQRLEGALRPLGHRGSPADLLARLEAPRAPQPRVAPRWQAAVAVVALLAAVVALQGPPSGTGRAGRGPWDVSAIDGTPRIAREMVETDATSRARIDVGSIGTVLVESESRVRLLDHRASRYRLSLERGTLRAVVWAPPGEFLVDTPSARAVDLGCAYTIAVDARGSGLLTVESGWVALEHGGREAFVPAGARCPTRRHVGPGLPSYLDASPAFQDALAAFERGEPALDGVLRHARARDAMTLWHLLTRTAASERAHVYDALAVLVPPPAGVSREAVLRGERAPIDAWWSALGLGSVDFWRKWKADWASR
jgi:hypothetical protein